MDKDKLTCTPYQVGMSLLTNMSPNNKQNEDKMENVSCACVVASLFMKWYA